MNGSSFQKWFGGVPPEIFGELPWRFLGRWLLPVGLFLLMIAYAADRNSRMEWMARYRYGTAASWWKSRFWKGMLSGLQKAGLLLAAAAVWDWSRGRISVLCGEEVIKTGVLWLLHMMSFQALFLMLELISVKHFVPALLLLLEGVTFLVGFWIKAVANGMYGMWGMYLRSSWHGRDGFSPGIVLGAEGLLVFLCYWAGKIYLKKAQEGVCV